MLGFFFYFFRGASSRPTLRGLGRGTVDWLAALSIVLAPVWVVFFLGAPRIQDVWTLLVLTASLAALMLVRTIAARDRVSHRRHTTTQRFTKRFAESMGFFRDAFSDHSVDPDGTSAREASRALLRTIADRARMLEPSPHPREEDLEALLMLFRGEDFETVEIAARSLPLRDGQQLPSEEAISYYVALKGERHVEHNWRQRRTPFKDAPVGAGRYRSFLFIPLLDHKSDRNVYEVLGVVAIASVHRYFFWWGRGELVRDQVHPCCTLLKTLLEGHPDRLTVKGSA